MGMICWLERDSRPRKEGAEEVEGGGWKLGEGTGTAGGSVGASESDHPSSPNSD